MKVGITLDDDLLRRLDEYADRNYMSRSGLITYVVTQFLNSQEMLFAIKDLSVAVRKIADNGEVDHEIMEQLDDFERLVKLMTSTKG